MALNTVTLTFTEQDAGDDVQAGSVSIAPTAAVVAAGQTVVGTTPIVRNFSGGTVSVSLVATDNTGTTPAAGFWAYQITLPGGAGGTYLLPFSGGSTQRFDNLTPVVSSITYGPAATGGGFTSPMSTLGDMIYENATPAAAALSGNTSATKKFLTQTGTGSVSAAPGWGTIAAADVPGVDGVTVSGTPSAGMVPTAISSSAATWQAAGVQALTFTYGSTGAVPSSGTFSAGALAIDQDDILRVCTVSGTPGTWRRVGARAHEFYVEDYGAKGDGKYISDATMGSSSTTLTSASNPFTSADVGKSIMVWAGTANPWLKTTISAYTSAGQVTLAASAPAAISAQGAVYGTDDTTAIQAAVEAASDYALQGSGRAGEVIFGAHIYCLATAATTNPTVAGAPQQGYAQIALPAISATQPQIKLALTGAWGGLEHSDFDTDWPPDSGTILLSMREDGLTDGTFGPKSVIGGPWTETSNMVVAIDGITVMVAGSVAAKAPYNGVNLRDVDSAWIGKLAVIPLAVQGNSAPGSTTTAWPILNGSLGSNIPSDTGHFCVSLPLKGNNDLSQIGTLICVYYRLGLFGSEHARIDNLITTWGGYGFAPEGGHGVTIGTWTCQQTFAPLFLNFPGQELGNGARVNVGMLDLETFTDIVDASFQTNHITGIINFEAQEAYPFNYGALILGETGPYSIKLISMDNYAGMLSSPPAVPANNTALGNYWYRDATVYITSGGAAVTAISIDGNATGLTLGTTGTVTVRVPSGSTITLTYASTAPTWKWELD